MEFDKGEAADRKLEHRLKSFIENHDFMKFYIDCKNLKIRKGAEFDLYDLGTISKITNFNARGSALLLRIALKNMQFFKNGGIITILNTNEDADLLKDK